MRYLLITLAIMLNACGAEYEADSEQLPLEEYYEACDIDGDGTIVSTKDLDVVTALVNDEGYWFCKDFETEQGLVSKYAGCQYQDDLVRSLWISERDRDFYVGLGFESCKSYEDLPE
jgi:hypothetical protein